MQHDREWWTCTILWTAFMQTPSLAVADWHGTPRKTACETVWKCGGTLQHVKILCTWKCARASLNLTVCTVESIARCTCACSGRPDRQQRIMSSSPVVGCVILTKSKLTLLPGEASLRIMYPNPMRVGTDALAHSRLCSKPRNARG
eukprot:1524674-Amphidinium_carterae.1